MIRTNEKTGQIWKSIALLQKQMPMIVKDKKADVQKYKYQYADLSSVWATVQPMLTENELVVVQSIREDTVTTRIVHVASGEWYEADSPIASCGGLKAQDIGAAQTYARRYALMTALFLIAAGDDDESYLAHRQLQRMEQGYRQDAIHRLVKLGMNSIEAVDGIDELLGDRKDNEIDRDEWLRIFRELKGRIPGQLSRDPLLEGANK